MICCQEFGSEFTELTEIFILTADVLNEFQHFFQQPKWAAVGRPKTRDLGRKHPFQKCPKKKN